MITPNPNQPREYFDPKKMEELEKTINDIGQQDPIRVVPYCDGKKASLFIIDGERRFRVLQKLNKQHAKIEIRWKENEREIFKAALVLNISKADHNPIELARAFKKLTSEPDPKWDSGINPVTALAQEIGLSEVTIRNHIRLLDLPEEIQGMIMEGTLPPTHILNLTRGTKKGRLNEEERKRKIVEMQLLARQIMDNIEKDREENGETGNKGKRKLTRANLVAAKREALRSQGRDAEAVMMEIHDSLYKTLNGMSVILNHSERLADPANEKILIESLRNRGEGKPPETVRDRIKKTLSQLNALLTQVNKAVINPPPIEKVEGKPDFTMYIINKPKAFGNIIRRKMALALANATDTGNGMITNNDLSKILKEDAVTIVGNIPALGVELSIVGIKLTRFETRTRKTTDSSYEKVPAYRLEWKDKSPQAAAPTADAQAPIKQDSAPVAPAIAVTERKKDTAPKTVLSSKKTKKTRANQPIEIVVKPQPLTNLVDEGKIPGVSRTDASKPLPQITEDKTYTVISQYERLYAGIADERLTLPDQKDPMIHELRINMNAEENEVIVKLIDRKPARYVKILREAIVPSGQKKKAAQNKNWFGPNR